MNAVLVGTWLKKLNILLKKVKKLLFVYKVIFSPFCVKNSIIISQKKN